MSIKCPKCHADNSETARFCSNCATSLGAAEAAPPSLTRTLESPGSDIFPGAVLAGRYEILELIGAGGMGEVYRAVDKSLDRQVAVKVLPAAFSQDKERLARFEREAKLLAALNHPHIASIHGLERSGERLFLVLELIEGESLRTRLARGPLPVEEAIAVCRQVAEGLEAAHARGIVHRDLKPGNIMLAGDDIAKILDFGLAKAAAGETTGIDIERSPTITGQMTAPGVILGTVAYMSPEQARGRPVDKRADIWAFGCVLFECLTGQQAFVGETVSDTLAHIIKGEPDWGCLPAGTPPHIRSLLGRCLEKDPKERLHDIADARIELQMTPRFVAGATSTSGIRGLRPAAIVAIGAAALIIGALVGPLVWRSLTRGGSSKAVPVVRASIVLPSGHSLGGGSLQNGFSNRPTRTELAVSADGRFLVYSATREGPGSQSAPSLYLRKLDELEARPVKGTEGGLCPFLSPRGDWIGFWAGGKLRKVPSEGGIPSDLCDVPRPFGFSWGDDDRIVFSRDRGTGLMRIPAAGGAPEVLTVPDRSRQEYAHYLPHVLPGSRGVLFTIKRHPWDAEPRLAVLDLGSGQWRVLLENAADGRYAATGHAVFMRQGTLMAVPFDAGRMAITGPAVPVAAGIEQTLNTTTSYDDTGAGQFDLSASGSLVYVPGGIEPDQKNTLVWVDAEGREEPIVAFKAPFFSTRVSPDGKRIAYTLLGMESHVWIHDLDLGTATKLTPEGMAQWALWTKDGERLIFDWLETGVPNLYWQDAAGGSPKERLIESEFYHWPGSLSPDGNILAFVEERQETDRDILFLDLRDRRTTPFLNSRFYEGYPAFSPDGRWIAYATDESGQMEVYVQTLSGRPRKWRVSHEGGRSPLWSPDGRRLYYRSGPLGSRIWAVDIEAGPDLSASRPRQILSLERYAVGSPIGTWDISRDGRRFLMVKLGGRPVKPVTEIILVQNWFEELLQLVSVISK